MILQNDLLAFDAVDWYAKAPEQALGSSLAEALMHGPRGEKL
jgi:hypothetical protein